MTDKFQPFEFLTQWRKEPTLEEKIEAIADSIQVLVVNLTRVSEYCDNRLIDLDGKIGDLSHRIELGEATVKQLDQKINSLYQAKAPIESIASIPMTSNDSIKQKQKIVTQNLHSTLMDELATVFKKRQMLSEE